MTMNRSTDELFAELAKAESYSEYVENNSGEMLDMTLAQWLEQCLFESGKEKKKVIQKSELNEIYAYQIFSGARRPSRDKLICLCVGMGMELEDCQRSLRYAGHAELYPRSGKDSIVIFGINNHKSVSQINELLFDNGEDTL